MAKSVLHFDSQIYGEYLQEASFLYTQRLACLKDIGFAWHDIDELERRFEAQIAALVEGNDSALKFCLQQIQEDDVGELHAALRVFCRQNRKDHVFEILSDLDGDNTDVVQAAAHALRQEVLPNWQPDLLRVFQGSQQHLNGVLAKVIGYRRFPAEEFLLRKLETTPEKGVADIAWALGRVGSTKALEPLYALLQHDEDAVCEAAAIAMMRLGDKRPIQHALLMAQTRSWPHLVLGIGGDRQAVSVLIDTLKGKNSSDNVILALGLLGDLRAVLPLVEKLEDEELAESAAIALNTITGAQLYNESLVPDAIVVDDLSDEEQETYKKEGKAPTREDGELFGSWEHRPVSLPEEWRAWLGQNKARFDRKHLWRMGKPHGPDALVDSLRAKMSTYDVRAASYEELVVRHKLVVPFEVELTVAQQDRFLRTIDRWVQEALG